ncbi:aldehyde dehydrogenase [Paraburkholderia sp. MPAMCS5]|uniref:aldehyde dehydrogenase n=1 Tax=Paraburkholderia sp. MPAMCS5 TaxID=3112563 RepID=UPI002E1780E9|nr:aldehyde dehydrogenase [Paraburkholderia sp. MPAMCS5]
MRAITFPESPAFEVKSPITGQTVTTATAATVDDVCTVAAAAAKAFPSWSKTSPKDRRSVLLKAAAVMENYSDRLIDCMVAETGTSVTWAQFNVRGAIGALNEAAALTTQIRGETIPSDVPGCFAMTIRTPVGVVLGIAPWNAPLLLGLRAVLMPIACGNTAILKASEACPGSHWLIGEVLREAGLPADVVRIVTNRPEDAALTVETLIAHPAVRRVNFTGSTKVGRIIGSLAGKYLKPAVLELGGKSPIVVLEDADLEKATAATSFGAYMNQGQICMSTERVIVDAKIADRFAELLVLKAANLSQEGGLISCYAAVHVEAMVQDAINKGAKLLTPLQRDGTRLRPVVLDHVAPGMDIYDQESFGPVAPIVRVNNAEEAIRVANDTEYGLAGAVFGRDLARTLDVAQRIETGICHINSPTVKSESQLPFGGVKASGYGRFGGNAAIHEFTELRTLTIQV